MERRDLLAGAGPAPTHLPTDPATELLQAGTDPAGGAGPHPAAARGAPGGASVQPGRGGRRLRLRADRLPPWPGPAAPGRLARQRPGAVGARAQPGLPALAGPAVPIG